MAAKKTLVGNLDKAAAPPIAIGGRTGVTAVFGYPVEHSMSPAMHNAAYAALFMDRVYLAFHVPPENLRAAMHAMLTLGFHGANLTVPHKQAAARFIQNLSAEAKLLRAVNCLINDRGKLRGDNTDARGLEADLRGLGVNLRSRLVIVIGAGGAAASAILACSRMGAARIVIANRTRSHVSSLVRRFRSPRSSRGVEFSAHGLDALTDAALLGDAALVLNATSMGLTTPDFAPLDYRATSSKCFFYDAVYRAEPTPFLREAVALGRPHADGVGMLINQGELAFELFNRVAPPSGVMRRTLLKHLGRTG